MATSKKLTPAALLCLQQERDNFWMALHTIGQHLPPEKLSAQSQKLYGLRPVDATEYAYENVLQVAKLAIKGTKKPQG